MDIHHPSTARMAPIIRFVFPDRRVRPTVGTVTTDLATQVQWLVDRASISDLLVEFARALDDRDWAAYGATYTPDGVFCIGDAVRIEGRDRIQAMTASERGPGGYAGTWHLSANHAITIDGDAARTRSYLFGAHMLGGGPDRHADGGGWYDCELLRTADGWRFTRVRINEVWTGGEPMPHVAELAAAPR